MRTNDGYIIRRCLNGEPEAFGFLVDRYKESIYAFAYSRLGNFHDAEDVAQEVFIKAYRNLHTLRQWDSFHAWIYSITSNMCKDWLKARDRRPDGEYIEDKDRHILQEYSIESYNDQALVQSLQDSLHSLPEMHQQVLTLHYLGGMSVKEMSGFLDIPANTILQRLHRARIQLREEMLALLESTFQKRALPSGFTLHIMETVKSIRINPFPKPTNIPWGISIATSIIVLFLGLGSNVRLTSPPDSFLGTDQSNMALSYMDISNIPVIVSESSDSHDRQVSGGNNSGQGISEMQDTPSTMPAGDGGRIPDMPSFQLGKGTLGGIAYSPDGRTFAVSTMSGVRLYDAENLNETGIFILDKPSEGNLSFSPDGRMLALINADGIVLWNVQEKRRIGTLDGGGTLSFSPDGRILASTGPYDDNDIRVWDMQKRERIGLLQGHTDYVRSIAFSPNGRILASASFDRTIRIWDIRECKQTGLLHEQNDVYSIAFSSDGNMLASGSGDEYKGSLSLWDINEQRMIASLNGHGAIVNSLGFSPDGNLLASGSYDRTIRLWDIAGRKEIGILQAHDSHINNVIFSSDGRSLLSSDPYSIRLWNINDLSQKRSLDGYMPSVYSVAFSPDGRIMASASLSRIILWDVSTQKQIGYIMPPESSYGGFLELAFSPDGKVLAASRYKSMLYLIDVEKREVMCSLKGHTDVIRSLAFSPDGRLLASGSIDMTLRLWDIQKQKENAAYKYDSHTHSVAFSPDGRTLACGVGGECAIRLWDVGTGKQAESLDNQGSVLSIAFSPDGKMLASGSTDSIGLWDFAHRKLLNRIEFDDESLTWHLAFSPDGRWLASQSASDGIARIWDVSSGKELANIERYGDIGSVSFSPDGKWMATGSMDGTISLWEVNIPIGTDDSLFRYNGK